MSLFATKLGWTDEQLDGLGYAMDLFYLDKSDKGIAARKLFKEGKIFIKGVTLDQFVVHIARELLERERLFMDVHLALYNSCYDTEDDIAHLLAQKKDLCFSCPGAFINFFDMIELINVDACRKAINTPTFNAALIFFGTRNVNGSVISKKTFKQILEIFERKPGLAGKLHEGLS